MKSFVRRIPITLIVSLSLLALLQIAIILKESYSEKGMLTFIKEYPEQADLQSKVVNISGAVLNPGLYSLKEEERLIDLVNKAGGFSKNSDQNYINKSLNTAEIPKDGSKYYIPFAAGSVEDLLNINTALQSELEELPNIGTTTAEKIIKNRPYNSLDELESKGILSAATYAKVKDLLTL